MKKTKDQCDMCGSPNGQKFSFSMCGHIDLNGEFSRREMWNFCTLQCMKTFVDKFNGSGFTSTIQDLHMAEVNQ